jgi:glucokinase
MSLAVGVVIAQSATRYSAQALDAPSGRIWRAHVESPLTPEEASVTVMRLVQAAQAALGVSDPSQVAVCCAAEAELDAEREHVVTLPSAPGWEGVAFRELVARRLPGQVSLATRTEASAVAEYERGAARGQRSSLSLLPARGVTACSIEQGRISKGAHGAAGALDHWPVGEHGPRCGCGGYGHLATLASTQSIVRRMIGRAAASDESAAAMSRISGGRAEALSAAQVVELAVAGDPAAQSVVQEAADALATAVAALSLMLDPGAIVVSGSLALAHRYYFQLLEERVRARLGDLIPPPALVPGHLEPNAALIGAGVLASRLYYERGGAAMR